MRLLFLVTGETNLLKTTKCLGCLFFIAVTLFASRSAAAQDWVRTGTGLGLAKPRVAVAEFGPRSDSAKSHATIFAQVVRDDLQFSGILELASPSFYPPQAPTAPP